MSSEAVTASTPGTSPAPSPTSRTARTTRTTRATSSPSRMARPSRTWGPFNSCSARTALAATMPRGRKSPASPAGRTGTTGSARPHVAPVQQLCCTDGTVGNDAEEQAQPGEPGEQDEHDGIDEHDARDEQGEGDEGGEGDENSEADHLACQDLPGRQPIILPVAGQFVLPQQAFTPKPPSELAAGAQPEFTSVSHNLVAEATSAAGAAVTYAAAAADGEIGIATITYSKASGSTFPLGTTTVTVTAIDEGGNLATSMFTILVQDTTPPATALSPPPPATTQGTDPRGAIVSFGATATDAVTASPLITYTQNPGTFFHVGRTWVTATATDAAGNSSSITFAVVVIDTIAPVITSAPDVVAEATAPWGANVVLNATATDAVGPVTLVYSPLSGSRFALGTTAVTVYAVDGAGNRSATRSFTVTVRDTTPPAITSISPSLFAQATSSAGAKVMYAAAKATDAVGPVTIAYSPLASGATFPVGPTIVTVTAVDGAGNAATASFTVTVQDTPVFTSVSGNVTVNAPGPTTPVTYALATATGVLGTPLIAYSQNTGSPFVPGITPVTVTATSFTGTVATRTFQVRVLDIPVITSVSPNLVAEATSSLGASVSYVAASATSLVAPPTVSYSIASGAVFPLGTNTVTA